MPFKNNASHKSSHSPFSKEGEESKYPFLLEQKGGEPSARITPRCPIFGECGGCLYQDREYPFELSLKQAQLKELLASTLGIPDSVFDPIVASPREYHYRHRLDLNFRRSKTGDFVFGFVNREGKKIVPLETCVIAREEISNFLPRLKQEAIQK